MALPQSGLTGKRLGHPRLHLRCTDSTNERARVLAIAGAPHGTLVTAAEQTAGRGRQGRRWSAPPGSALLMSLVLRDPRPSLPLAAAVAVCDVAGPDVRIKWPNDVVVELRSAHDGATDDTTSDRRPQSEAATASAPGLAKLAGILVEGRPQQGWAVLGIGLNVAVRLEDLPAELRPGGGRVARGAESSRAPTLATLPAATLGLDRDAIEPVLAQLLGALQRRLEDGLERTLEAWRARDALRGREIAWNAGRGTAAGIDGDGRLVVRLPDGGQRALAAGEVHLAGVS
jgi:BirA family biotin operon repressor/biotin-[acetyl-CoA-carboxylase] ligase